jgi:hypothetical protein
MVAAAEALLTGIVTAIYPTLFCRLVFGAELTASGPALGPLAGIAMLGVGMAAWPARLPALLTYNVLATLYLAYLALAGAFVGVLLLPAIALHAALSVLLLLRPGIRRTGGLIPRG